MKKMFLGLVLSLILVIGIVLVTNVCASTVVDSGSCGDNLTWVLDSQGTLTISGSGKMYDWDSSNLPPWYYYDDVIKSVKIDSGATHIGNYAFGNLVKSNYQQYDYDCIQTVSFPNSLISIGNYAFDSCNLLTGVIIPDSVTVIGKHAFYDCSSLKSITLPDSVKTIGAGVFASCDTLTSIKLSNNITEIPASAFANSSALTNVLFPENVTAIGSNAFVNCSSLTSMIIPDSVITIGTYAFEDCTSLTSLSIGDSVTTIEDFAFDGCSNLTSISIGNSLSSLNGFNFTDCINLTDIVIGDSVTTIPAGSFADLDRLTTVKIGDGVKTIGVDAFSCCDSLSNITLGKGLISIGNSAFDECISLTNVTIPDGVTTIGDYAFKRCSSLSNISIGNGVTTIGISAFAECSSLEQLMIPDSVINIGSGAFENCPALTDIIIGNGVTSLDGFNFYDYDKLNSIVIGDSVTSLDPDLFVSDYLLNVKIGKGITTADSGLFIRNKMIQKISIPFVGSSRSSTSSSEAVLGHLFSQTKFSDGEYVEAEQYYSSSNYKTYYIPTSLKQVYITDATQIPYGAFSGCSGIEYIELNEGITQISQRAFADCGFLSVHIPKSVTRIGADAFTGTDIEKLYVSKDSYGHQYAETNGYSYEFFDYYTVTGIALYESEITINEADTYKLRASIKPDNASSPVINWNSSDENIATVDENGLVTALSKGTATITATTEENNFTASCVVNVLRPVSSIELNYSELNIGVGYTKTLIATVYPETASNASFVWSTDDASIATVSNGIVTAVGYGTTKIKATTVDGGYVAECTINSTIPVNGISLNKSNIEMIAGDTVSLVATVTPTDAFDKSVIWSSSNTTVATVENGLVTAKSEGTVTITAKTNDGGKTASCVITVNAPVVNVTDITLNKCDISLNVGESETLVATITPSTATNKNVVWTSSNESIATVDENGKVTAKTNGIAIITATTADGNKEVTCTVTVTGESDNEIVIGDVNGDGEVDFADAIVVLKHDAGITTLTGDKLTAADTNGDGDVDFVDAIQILKYDSGLISSFN